MIDLLSTKDGKISQKYPKYRVKPHISIFAVNPDIMAPTTFKLPRLVHGAFVLVLKEIYLQIYKEPLEVTQYGKPKSITYDYTSTFFHFCPKTNPF